VGQQKKYNSSKVARSLCKKEPGAAGRLHFFKWTVTNESEYIYLYRKLTLCIFWWR